MLLLSMLGSVITHRTIWALPNLLATTFFGDIAYRWGFHRWTIAGLALYFFIYALLGMVWGIIVRDDLRIRVLWLSAIFGIAIYYGLFLFVWPQVNPMVSLYAPASNLRLGHLFWGFCLSRAPRYARYIREATAEELPPPMPPALTPPQLPRAESEIKSGEVIL